MNKKFLLVPDSFKGNLSSLQVCEIMEKSIRKFYENANVISVPVADGGEGSVDAFLTALGGKKICLPAQGPFGKPVDAFYGILPDNTAIIETAACAGLHLANNHLDPLNASTFGVGELIKHAVKKSGCKKIIIGLGGSCTNDGGVGLAAALGIKFFNRENKIFLPTGGTLNQIAQIDNSELLPELSNVKIIAICDIDNPMYGKSGAAYIFASQKGASADELPFLDANLQHLSNKILQNFHKDVSSIFGGGAAGGMGAGLCAFLNAELKSGIQTILDAADFDSLLKNTDLVFTGEGKLDEQSLHGKVVCGVGLRAKKQNVPVFAVVGDIGENIEKIYSQGINAVFSINRIAQPFEKAKQHSAADLAFTVESIMRFMKTFHQ